MATIEYFLPGNRAGAGERLSVEFAGLNHDQAAAVAAAATPPSPKPMLGYQE